MQFLSDLLSSLQYFLHPSKEITFCHHNQFAPEGKTFVDSFSAVSQISLTLCVVMSIVLQGKTKPLQFISIQNYNLLMLQYI